MASSYNKIAKVHKKIDIFALNMAVLKKIVVQNFRNIELAELVFSANINCISGGNGEGKTNLLDAIYYLSMTKSAFNQPDKFCLRHGAETFSIAGTYSVPDSPDTRYSIRFTPGTEKKLKRDDKMYDKISSHIGEVPVVMVSPADVALVSESGEDRRRFLNQVLSQMDKVCLSDMQQYNKLLAQRNQMLKTDSPDTQLMDIIDESLAYYGGRIFDARSRFIADLSPVVGKYYALLSGEKESVSVEYRSDLKKGDFIGRLRSSRQRDLALGFTSSGIQKDDMDFVMDGFPIKRCGSQGQQKSFLVSLKFAQYEIMKAHFGEPPALLLDDVFDKLDMSRTANLLSMVAGNDFGQIFITDSNKVRLSGIVDGLTEDRAYFEARSGRFEKEEM